jgi:ATP-dependent helicase/nuclease subunit B
MLQAMRLETGRQDLTYEQLRDELGTPETLVAAHPKQALTDAAWWLSLLKLAGERGSDAVLEAFPSLADGRIASDARGSDDYTEWDGFVPAAAALLDPRASLKPASATRLERLVECPFKYFIEHGLGLEVLAEDPDHDEWLDPMQKGAALHEVFATLGREARAQARRLSLRKDVFRARQLADEMLAALRAQCPPPSEVVFDRERAEFLRDVELFVEFEEQRGDSEPVAFEVAFGHDAGGEEPLAQADPVEISLGKGEGFLLRGTIDRVDRLPDGSYEVIDYKTGKFDSDKYQGTFGKGALLQHALYGLAAKALLRRIEPRPHVARGVYEFPSARGGGERVEITPPSHAALVRVLSDLFDVIASGTFVPTDQKKKCEWCDFSCACGMPWEQGKAKLANEENAALEAYRRLRQHE